jgi:hypothetical protein
MFTAGYAQMPDNAKLDQFLTGLPKKNKAMGSLTLAEVQSRLLNQPKGSSEQVRHQLF